MIKIAALFLALMTAGMHAKPILIDKPAKLWNTAPSTAGLYRQIVKKNKWGSLKDVEIDTVGEFDINGLPAFAINIYSLNDLNFEEFYLVFTKGGRVHYSLLATTSAGRKAALEQFRMVTRDNIYLFMEFNETHKDDKGNPTGRKLKLYIVSFTKTHQQKYVAYNLPLKISDENMVYQYMLDIYVPSDTLMIINTASKELKEEQKKLVGEHRF